MSEYTHKHKWLTDEEMDSAPKALLISEIRHYRDRLWKTEAEWDEAQAALTALVEDIGLLVEAMTREEEESIILQPSLREFAGKLRALVTGKKGGKK